jgi:phenylacetate-coenzyme A ligase PaaK-like adenylate-forming protein
MLPTDSYTENVALTLLGRTNREIDNFIASQWSELGFHPSSLSHTALQRLKEIPAYTDYDFGKDWSDLPLIDKHDLRREISRFQPCKASVSLRWSKFTSGTTGTPVKCTFSPRFYLQNYYNKLAKAALTFGVEPWSGNRHFSMALTDNDEVRSECRVSPCLRLGKQFAYSMNGNRSEDHLKALELYAILKPQVFSTKPAIYQSLIDCIKANRRTFKKIWNPELLICSGSKISDPVKREAEEIFGAPLVSSINSTEMGYVGSQCKVGNYHLDHSSYFFENQVGSDELIVTNLKNALMPLIRYQTGDRGVISHQVCRCGRKSPHIEKF